MPPRKRAKTTASTASTPLGERSQPTTAATPQTITYQQPTTEDILNDPWTDEEEIALFKGVVRWKPTGMHKHFRMLSISQSLRSNPSSEHTRMSGIWRKLGTLYDLDALDERENANEAAEWEYAHEEDEDYTEEFELPEEDFGEMMWERRLASEGGTSMEGEGEALRDDESAGDAGGGGRTTRAKRTRGSMVDDGNEGGGAPASASRRRGRGEGDKATPRPKAEAEWKEKGRGTRASTRLSLRRGASEKLGGANEEVEEGGKGQDEEGEEQGEEQGDEEEEEVEGEEGEDAEGEGDGEDDEGEEEEEAAGESGAVKSPDAKETKQAPKATRGRRVKAATRRRPRRR